MHPTLESFFEAIDTNNLDEVRKIMADEESRTLSYLRDGDGCTPLCRAVKKGDQGDLEIVKVILERSQSENMQDNGGRSPLYHAASYGMIEIIEEILKKDQIYVNTPDNFPEWGYTPLILAIQNGDIDTVNALLAYPGIDVNKQDREQNVPLVLATKNGHTEIVRQLLTIPNIDFDLVDGSGKTALETAIDDGLTGISHLIATTQGARERAAAAQAAAQAAAAQGGGAKKIRKTIRSVKRKLNRNTRRSRNRNRSKK